MGDRHLVMTFGTDNSNGQVDFYVDYVKVEKGWYANNNGIAVDYSNVAVGSELPEPEHSSDMTFLGWYSDVNFTNVFGTVLEGEYRRAYAKYSKTYIGFNEGGFSDSRNYAADLTADPKDGKNKVAVLKLSDSGRGNIEIARYDASDAAYYELKDNTGYTVTYRYYIEDDGSENNVDFELYTGSYADYVANDKSPIGGTEFATSKSGQWLTATANFTTGSMGQKNHLYVTALAFGTTKEIMRNVYFDDIIISENAEYSDVTVNENGYITTVSSAVGKELAAGKNTAEKTFLAWYSDPDCKIPFGTVAENETRTAFAQYDMINQRFENVTSVTGKNAEIAKDADNAHNSVLKFNDAGVAEIPSYDAAGAGSIILEKGKNYAVRFRYKRLAGSKEGAFIAADGTVAGYTVLAVGNSFGPCDGGDNWTTGAVAFTAGGSDGQFVFGVTGDGAKVMIDDIRFYEIAACAETTVTGDDTLGGSSSSSFDTSIGSENGSFILRVSVNPADGEQLAANGLSVTYDAMGSAFSEEVTRNVFETGENSLGYEFEKMIPASARNIRVNAVFTAANNDNMAIIASSYREKSEKYTTGIRFRARIYDRSAASVSAHGAVVKTGFLVTPTKLMEAAGQTELTVENYELCKAVNADATGVIYDKTEKYTDYQVLLKGETLDKLKNTDFTVVAYLQYADGTCSYTKLYENSYNKIYSLINAAHNGIDGYYNEEFESLRDDFRLVQQGNFSYLYITDLHIDYVKSSDDIPSEPAVLRSIKALIEIANTTDVDCIIFGGDIIHGTSSKAVSIEKFRQYVRYFKEANVPVFVTKGNHDSGDYSSGYGYPSYNPNCVRIQGIISLEEWYEEIVVPLAGDRIVHDSRNAHSTYYYIDFPEKKTRLIITDCYDAPFAQNGKFLFDDE